MSTTAPEQSPVASATRPATASRKKKGMISIPLEFLCLLVGMTIVGAVALGVVIVHRFESKPTTCTRSYRVKAGDSWYKIGGDPAQSDPEKNHWFNAGASAALSYPKQPVDVTLGQRLKIDERLTTYCGGPPPKGATDKVATG